MHRRDSQAIVWTTIHVRAIHSLRCRFVPIRIRVYVRRFIVALSMIWIFDERSSFVQRHFDAIERIAEKARVSYE